MSGFITREEREAAKVHVNAGRLCYRCGGRTEKETGQRMMCARCVERAEAEAERIEREAK